MKGIIYIVFLAFTLCGIGLHAQVALADVDNQKISEKQLMTYLKHQEQQNIKCFKDFHPSWNDDVDSSNYCRYEKVYTIKENIEAVWRTYIKTSPSVSWKSPKSKLGLLYNRNSDEVIYAEDTMPAPANGHLMFLHLKLVKGLYKMATAMEVTDVSEEENYIELSYIETGVAHGKQRIQLETTEQGFTKVIHTTVVHSNSRFRDRVVYPYFHNKLINAFHRNMKRLATNHKETIAALSHHFKVIGLSFEP